MIRSFVAACGQQTQPTRSLPTLSAMIGATLAWALLSILPACGGQPMPTQAAPQGPTAEDTPAPTPTTDDASLVLRGQRLADVIGCYGCHSIDGRTMVGPTWKGLYGSTVAIDGGRRIVQVDDDYLRESIREPKAKIVHGFFDLMPDTNLDDRDIDALIAYIKTVR